MQQQENLKQRLVSQQLENAVLQEKLQSEILKQHIQQIEGSAVQTQVNRQTGRHIGKQTTVRDTQTVYTADRGQCTGKQTDR